MFASIYRWWPNTKVVAIKSKGGYCWNYGLCVGLDGNPLIKYVLDVNIDDCGINIDWYRNYKCYEQ